MKNSTLLILLLCLTGCFGHTPPKTGLEGKPMPTVNLLLSDSNSYLNTKNIPKGQSAVIFYFMPQCPYCRAQMTEMTEKIRELKNVRIYAITFSKFKNFKSFCNEFKLNKYASITAGLDYTDSMARYFKIQGVPFTAIYNQNKKLSQAFPGRISVSQIKNAIEN